MRPGRLAERSPYVPLGIPSIIDVEVTVQRGEAPALADGVRFAVEASGLRVRSGGRYRVWVETLPGDPVAEPASGPYRDEEGPRYEVRESPRSQWRSRGRRCSCSA